MEAANVIRANQGPVEAMEYIARHQKAEREQHRNKDDLVGVDMLAQSQQLQLSNSLMQQMVSLQEQQNQLLEDLNIHLVTTQRQRASELGMWKEAHPDLARNCRLAAETLSRVQTQFLRNLTEDVEHNEEALVDGEFMLNEFVDRYGPRLAHLNGVLQVLSQLSGDQTTTNSSV